MRYEPQRVSAFTCIWLQLEDEKGKVYSHKTNIANSIYTVWLHYESDSGIPHLHAAVCRKDSDGKTNNDHNIHIRAQDAAQAVAIRRGWITAAEIHRMNAGKIADDLMEILRAMPSWSWNDYAARIRAKGYTVMIRPGKKGVYGYSIGMGKASFKASELGTELPYRHGAAHKTLVRDSKDVASGETGSRCPHTITDSRAAEHRCLNAVSGQLTQGNSMQCLVSLHTITNIKTV